LSISDFYRQAKSSCQQEYHMAMALFIYFQEYANYIREIRQFYFNDKEVNASTLNEYTQFISDVFITYAINLAARKQAKRSTGRTYFFE
jgi:hypothetical protein